MFAVLVGIASAVTLWLFYRQCVESMLGTGLYHSDMKAYILEMQGLDSGYSFPYPILFKLAAVIHLVTGSLPTGTGHGAGSDVAEQRSDDRPENNVGQARGGGVA